MIIEMARSDTNLIRILSFYALNNNDSNQFLQTLHCQYQNPLSFR